MEVYFKVDEGDYRVVAPVKLGLHHCFSDICQEYRTRYFSSSGRTAPSSPKYLLPALIPQRFEQMEEPFFTASAATLVLLLLSVLVSCLQVSLHLYCSWTPLRKRDLLDIADKCRLLLSLSTMLGSAAAGIYIQITVDLLGGGRYLDGLWTVLAASLIGLLTSVVLHVIDREPSDFEYSPIADADSRGNADSLRTV